MHRVRTARLVAKGKKPRAAPESIEQQEARFAASTLRLFIDAFRAALASLAPTRTYTRTPRPAISASLDAIRQIRLPLPSGGGYVPLAQGAIDYALSGLSSLAEAMAVGSGLEEFVDVDAAAPLADASVEALLAQRA